MHERVGGGVVSPDVCMWSGFRARVRRAHGVRASVWIWPPGISV